MYQSHRYYRGGVRQSSPGFIVSAGGFAAFDKGFDFAVTSNFVTHPANTTYVLSDEPSTPDVYPTPRNASTFGWNIGSGLQGRNRNASLDPRLASTAWNDSSNYFLADLAAAGTYNITVAVGDASNGETQGFVIKDNTTTLWTVSPVSIASGSFLDALGNQYSAANWPASNQPKQLVFSSTTFRAELINLGVPGFAHIFISRVS